MRTDPRKACGNERELWFWAAVHDLIAHPLMVLTCYSKLSLRFHDFTSHHAWPRDMRVPVEPIVVYSDRFGAMTVALTATGVYEVTHGRIAHRFCTTAADVTDAVERAEQWFSELAEIIPHSDTGRSL